MTDEQIKALAIEMRKPEHEVREAVRVVSARFIDMVRDELINGPKARHHSTYRVRQPRAWSI